MCSVEDSGDKTPAQSNPKSSLVGSRCVKCGDPGVLITRIHDSFCKSCFQVYVVHKFRSAIGKSKLIRDGETVLVAFSGGGNSAALLHLIQDGLSLRAHKRLRFTPTLLHIDETGLYGNMSTEYRERQERVMQMMLNSGFPSYWTQLEQSLSVGTYQSGISSNGYSVDDTTSRDGLLLIPIGGDSGKPSLPSAPSAVETEKLKKLIKSFGNPTSQEDFIQNLRNQLLVVAARQLGFTKVLTAETSTRLSVKILSDIAQGRGSQVALDTGIGDDRNADVMIMRPVRDLNAKELAMYNSLFGVESIFMPSLTTKTSLASSIERLTETFVTGLQADFPSTVSNIVRTSGKLDQPDTKTTDKCSFCQSPLDTKAGGTSALAAVLFSQQLSRTSGTVLNSQGQEQGSADTRSGAAAGEEDTSTMSMDKLNDALCYGCRLSLRAFDGDASSLPPLVTKTALLSTRDKQKEQLAGFLLEGEAGSDDVDEER